LNEILAKNLKEPKKKEAIENLFMKSKNKRMQFSKFYKFIETNWGATVDDSVLE